MRSWVGLCLTTGPFLTAGLALALGACAAPGLTVEGAPRAPPPRAPVAREPTGPWQPLEEQEVGFDHGEWRLSGTLVLPARRAGLRVPAIVIVPGSGALSRDGIMVGQLGLGFGFELPVYRSLSASLVERGYAVYRYDKRTCSGQQGCAENDYPVVPYELQGAEYSTVAYQGDAEAALARVAEHPAVDPARIFVVGHSQGGSLVPALLRALPQVTAGVMLAPPFHPLAELIDAQAARVEWAFSTSGQPGRAARAHALLATAADSLRDVESGRHLGAPILGQPPAVWSSWLSLSRDAPRIAASLDRPLLVVGGAYDYNVEPLEIAAWGELLGTNARVPHRVRLLPCVTHALNCVAQPDPSRITAADIGHTVAPAVVDEVATFLARFPATAGR